MRFLLDQPFGAFDLETTAVDTTTARIVTGAVALLQPAQPTWKQQINNWLTAVEDCDIPAEATAIHGITTEFARTNGNNSQWVIAEIVNRLVGMLNAQTPIVGMNLAYDFTVLDRCARRLELPTLSELAALDRIVDVYVIDKWLDPYRPGGRKLTDLIQFYRVRHEGAHDATGDALAAARVAYRMAQMCERDRAQLTGFFQSAGRRQPQDVADRFIQLGQMDARGLHAHQVLWRETQQASLREYLVRKGEKDPDCAPHWPVRPFYADEEVSRGDS